MRTTLTRLLGLCLLVLLGTGLNPPARAAERVTWYHNDLQGSPVAATDRNGDMVWREQYKPYGRRTLKEDGGSNKLWYTGKAHEEGARLSYYGARWYHPEIGRFMAIDPVDFTEDNVQSFNRYAYANNNPYRYVDPDGRAPWDRNQKGINNPFGLDAGFGPGRGPGGKLDVGAGRVNDNKSFSQIKAEQDQGLSSGAMARGRDAEARVLNELGLPKNTQKVTTTEGNSIPDALTSTRSVEIKDTVCVSCTRQVRIQTDAAREAGRESVLITGERTHITPQAERAFGRNNIIRRKDLGPQQ